MEQLPKLQYISFLRKQICPPGLYPSLLLYVSSGKAMKCEFCVIPPGSGAAGIHKQDLWNFSQSLRPDLPHFCCFSLRGLTLSFFGWQTVQLVSRFGACYLDDARQKDPGNHPLQPHLQELSEGSGKHL
jgi:hypothetical protein